MERILAKSLYTGLSWEWLKSDAASRSRCYCQGENIYTYIYMMTMKSIHSFADSIVDVSYLFPWEKPFSSWFQAFKNKNLGWSCPSRIMTKRHRRSTQTHPLWEQMMCKVEKGNAEVDCKAEFSRAQASSCSSFDTYDLSIWQNDSSAKLCQKADIWSVDSDLLDQKTFSISVFSLMSSTDRLLPSLYYQQ